VAAAVPESTSTGEAGILPTGISPYVVALAALALVWAGVEGVVIARRRSRKKG
jgi:hypothetical protein